MLYLKKLLFAPVFLIFFMIFLQQLAPLFKSYDFIFSISVDTLVNLIIISALIVGSSFSFILFSAFALDWKYILPVVSLASLICFVFVDSSLGLVLAIGSFVSMILSLISLEKIMKSYLTFHPNSILGPYMKQLSTLLILVFCVGYFLSVSKIIAEKGFQIPDSLIDTTIKFTQPQGTSENISSPQLSLSPDQLDLLRKNPDLIRQSGLDPKILDSLNQPIKPVDNTTNNLLKQTIKNQLQGFLKPYLNFIPVGLAVLLFLTLQSLTSILNLLISPLLWITFYILEKTGFTKFEEEMRPVRKMVI